MFAGRMSYVECLVITNGKVLVPCYCHLKDLMLDRRLFHSPNAYIRNLFLCSNHNEGKYA